MPFIKYIPHKRTTYDATTSNEICGQLWQEFTIIRHLKKPIGIAANKVVAPWIDQAKQYFLDARKSNWKSGGLLYYYSFLNLAKAYLVAKKACNATVLKSTNIYHGLYADPQNPQQIIDFKIQILPPKVKGKINIFSLFYERLIGCKWPFSQSITIDLKDVITYCEEIGCELKSFYQLDCSLLLVQSLVREEENRLWFEINAANSYLSSIMSQINLLNLTPIDSKDFLQTDFYDWLIAYDRTAISMQNTSFLRTPIYQLSIENRNDQYKKMYKEVSDAFEDSCLYIPKNDMDTNQCWHFIPKATINGAKILWHPLLSDYLVAFVLSTILRYRPHLFPHDKKDAFIAEAWCNQSALTALRRFLMEFTERQTRLN